MFSLLSVLLYVRVASRFVYMPVWADWHPAIALATTVHLFHVWEQCTSGLRLSKEQSHLSIALRAPRLLDHLHVAFETDRARKVCSLNRADDWAHERTRYTTQRSASIWRLKRSPHSTTLQK